MEYLLERREPSLALITGAAGTGKTALLNAFARRAAEADWTVADSLSVSPSTTQDEFMEPLRALTAVPKEFPIAALERPEEILGRRVSDRSEPTATAQEAASPLIRALQRRRPLLLRIDGYRPTPDLHRWLSQTFLPQLLSAGGPVVVAFAERKEHAGWVRSSASLEIELGAVSQKAVRLYFANVAQEVSPPADEAELETWVSSVCKHPELIEALARALEFASDRDVSRSSQ